MHSLCIVLSLSLYTYVKTLPSSRHTHNYNLVLGNISIFWKYRGILFDNISYRIEKMFLISKYRISILIVFIVFMYATNEVYSLDMSTRVI